MNNNVILYTTHCPKCKVLEIKLSKKGIEYTEVNDVEVMKQKNILSVPVLEVDGTLLKFKEANDYINTIQVGE